MRKWCKEINRSNCEKQKWKSHAYEHTRSKTLQEWVKVNVSLLHPWTPAWTPTNSDNLDIFKQLAVRFFKCNGQFSSFFRTRVIDRLVWRVVVVVLLLLPPNLLTTFSSYQHYLLVWRICPSVFILEYWLLTKMTVFNCESVGLQILFSLKNPRMYWL